MDKIKKLLPFLLLLVLASLVIVQVFPLAHPYGGLSLPLDAQAIELKSREILTGLGKSAEGLTPQVQLRSDDALFRELQLMYGIEKANELARKDVAVFRWEVNWRKPSGAMFSSVSKNNNNTAEQVAEMIRGEIYLQLGTDGRLLQFDQKLPDTIALTSLPQPDAKALATKFLHSNGGFSGLVPDSAMPSSEKKIEQKKRIDYEFTWDAKSPTLGNPMHITVVVAGPAVSRFDTKTDIPEQYKKTDLETASEIVLVIVYIIVIMIMIVVAFRRFRSFELGFRLAIAIGLVVGGVDGIVIYLTTRGDQGWEFLIPLILGPLIVGGALVLVWAVSESIVRETWKEKLVTFDLLSKGYGYHSRVGESVVRGISLGLASLALSLLLTFGFGKFLRVSATSMDGAVIESFGAAVSWLFVAGHGVSDNAYKVSVIILFSITFLRRRFSSQAVVIILGSLVVALTTGRHLSPVWIAPVIQALASAVVVWGFYRYDALAAFLALYTYTVVAETGGLLVAGNPTYAASGYVNLGFLFLLVVGGVASQLRKREISDFDEIMPAFAKHITERQRLQQELEIARSVQMSFLPKTNPRMVELDIASRCAPALEVGGDYYDFIDLRDNRLGVVVGDVSGKGTQAAFFMTLTKGFVRALAAVSNSPSAVLTQVNKLFYENVDRGVFISMVYGIFDTRGHALTLARAGHNPVIMRKTQAEQVQVVNPMGLALGLDAGETFAKSIQEVTIPFQSGDLFVFYTDGFPEAMNKTLEEFGEDRLCQTVQKYAAGTSAEIMDGVFAEMKQFVGKAKQHDDMTIVVVKIT